MQLYKCVIEHPAQPNAIKLSETVRAYQRLKALAESGDVEAQFNLGVMHEQGKGALQDFKESMFWYQQASDQGYALAQYTLATKLYFSSSQLNASKDYVEIHKLCNLAAAQGIEDAIRWRDLAEKSMTKEQVEKAQALAREIWQRLMP